MNKHREFLYIYIYIYIRKGRCGSPGGYHFCAGPGGLDSGLGLGGTGHPDPETFLVSEPAWRQVGPEMVSDHFLGSLFMRSQDGGQHMEIRGPSHLPRQPHPQTHLLKEMVSSLSNLPGQLHPQTHLLKEIVIS